MEISKCSGYDALTGETIAVTFGNEIVSSEQSADVDEFYLAPGFIDLQVNGFAGVDYNNPNETHDAIAASLRAQFELRNRKHQELIDLVWLWFGSRHL